MEDDQKNTKWKTTKKIQNGRQQPKKSKMEDNKKNVIFKISKCNNNKD